VRARFETLRLASLYVVGEGVLLGSGPSLVWVRAISAKVGISRSEAA
jgi:hypothetical protein